MKIINNLKSKWSFIIATAAAFTFLFCSAPSNVLAADVQTNAPKASEINVSGNGEITATPDIAYISLGVSTEKATVNEAQSVNSDAMNNLISAIKKEGIAAEDIKTTNYSISPKYNYEEKTGNSTLVGYTVSNSLSVTVRDITKAGKVIDAAVANGSNLSNGISFGVSDYEKYYNQALVKAISNAQSKAQVIADSIGVKIAAPSKVDETSSGVQSSYPFYRYAAADMAVSNAAPSGTSVQAGTYKIKASVNMVYQY